MRSIIVLLALFPILTALVSCDSTATEDKPLTTPNVSLRIELAQPAAINTSLVLNAIFENHSDQTVKIITPQDGSFAGWLSPTYQISASNLFGTFGRCGNHGAQYNEKSIKSIPAGESLTLKLPTPNRIAKPGKEQVSLTYEVKPNSYPGKTYAAPSAQPPKFKAWPKGILVGKVVSNEIELVVE